MNTVSTALSTQFSGYQKFVLTMLAFLQFAVILDFMLMSPLGAVIMPALNIGPKQFGLVVSAYAFSAGAAGLLTAGFADRFDRKKLLLFFYTGFIAGTYWCGVADTFESLLAARIVTGLFGGVIGSVVLAIATDLFPLPMRGRVMGVLQSAFAVSQIMGIPVGLYLSNHWNWHVPFLALATLALAGGIVVVLYLQPIAGHLAAPQQHGAFTHLSNTLREPRYLLAFAVTSLLATGGFMLMPFGSAYTVANLGLDMHDLPTVYLITGACTMFYGPLIGKAADKFGQVPLFMLGSALAIVMVLIYTHLGPITLPALVAVNVLMLLGIFSRAIPFQVLASAIPVPAQRGAFNAVSASVQQLSGGVAALVAGYIVTVGPGGKLQHFDVVGYVVVATSLVTVTLVWLLQRGTVLRPRKT